MKKLLIFTPLIVLALAILRPERGNSTSAVSTMVATIVDHLGNNISIGTASATTAPPTMTIQVANSSNQILDTLGTSASVLSTGSSTALTNSANNFQSLASGQCGAGNEAGCLSPVPLAGTHRNLYCKASTAVVAGSWNFSLRVNGATPASEPNCTMSSGTTCSDTTDTASTNAGDTVDILAAPTSTPTAVALHCSWELDH